MTKQTLGWKPLAGSQSLAISCPVDEVLYHGTRGSSKSAAQIAKFLGYVGRGYGKHWRGAIFDRGYKNLDDMIAKSLEMIPKVFPDAVFLASKADLMWKFKDGEVLMFRHCKTTKDYRQYHGQEFPFLGFNELTSYPTSEVYDLLRSCNRCGFIPEVHAPGKNLPDIPLITFSTTNPHGAGHNWVKKKFISPARAGEVVRVKSRIFNPRTQQDEDITTTQVAIFGSYRENKYLDPKYVAGLNAIKDPNKRRAWLGGDWDVTSGGALDDLWNERVHILPRFAVPNAWRLTRSFDWGSSHPFSVCFWAIANGEEVRLPSGKIFCPESGSLILFDEIYGGEESLNVSTGQMEINYGSNKGLKLSAREVARRVVEKEQELAEDEWITESISPGPADNQINNVNESESGSIAKIMAKEGIEWTASDKSAGTRIAGLELIRSALENAVQGEGAGLYVMRNCQAFIETVPGIPRDEDKPDDVDTTSLDHIYDAVRYMLLDDKPVFASEVDIDQAM
jgi:hypothetical protein